MQSNSPDHAVAPASVGVVVIGRNEGERLVACLRSLENKAERIVYVDSGSADDSIQEARRAGADVVVLDKRKAFTAARSRNAGAATLMAGERPVYIQFVDGDCEIAAGWLQRGAEYLERHPDVAVVFGAVEEKFPEKTFFNRMIDREWRGEPGPADFCGGIAMFRTAAFDDAGGFREDLIAGEEPELCVRIRQEDHGIVRLETPMARHDADMRTVGQWLKRARRAGHAFAEVSTLHRGSPQRIWARETLRALLWTGLAVLSLVAGAFVHPAFLIGLAIFPLQIVRMGFRDKPLTADSFRHAALMMLQKPWEAAGVLQFWRKRFTGGRTELIEYRADDNADRAP